MKKLKSKCKPILLSALFFSSHFLAAPALLAEKKNDIKEKRASASQPKYTPEQIRYMKPPSANPWLSMTPKNRKIDWNYWNMKRGLESQERMHSIQPADARIVQPAFKSLAATSLSQFGTAPGQVSSLEISGEFTLPTPIKMTQKAEDEGSISLATETPLLTSGGAVIIDGVIGDGSFGSKGTGTGDFDFYAIRNAKAGQVLLVDVDTPEPFSGLDSIISIYNSKGRFVGFNDDGSAAESRDSLIRFTVPQNGDYFVSVFGRGAEELDDPFDSSTGLGKESFDPLSEGAYTVTIGLDYLVNKEYVFNLSSGDVFGASILKNGDSLTLKDPLNTIRQASTTDLTFIMPKNSPLPAGKVSVNHVADESGVFTLSVRSMKSGPFTLRLEAAVPPLYGRLAGKTQVIFVDFDGATVDLSESVLPNSAPGKDVKTLSPLSTFLPRWGLSKADENILIDRIMQVVQDRLVDDIKIRGTGGDFDIQLLNSRDFKDPFGKENVSRIIVGGTIAELGIDTIGIAQSIDVGNFDTSETAFVLLDSLSDPSPRALDSINRIKRANGVSIVEAIAVAVGETISHEAGHYLGNWHTDERNKSLNIMDRGGQKRANLTGIGADNIFGTADDQDVRFGRDIFTRREGISGIENTLTTIEWGTPEGFDDDEYEEVDD